MKPTLGVLGISFERTVFLTPPPPPFSGIDLAFIENGFIYHTKYDTADRILTDSIQRAGTQTNKQASKHVLACFSAVAQQPSTSPRSSDQHVRRRADLAVTPTELPTRRSARFRARPSFPDGSVIRSCRAERPRSGRGRGTGAGA